MQLQFSSLLFGKMSAILNQRISGTLPRSTFQNAKNDSHYLAITTWSCKAAMDPYMPIVDDVRNDIMDVDDSY